MGHQGLVRYQLHDEHPEHHSLLTAALLSVCAPQAAVNLLGSVLDTPEFFWSAPDQLQVCMLTCDLYHATLVGLLCWSGSLAAAV